VIDEQAKKFYEHFDLEHLANSRTAPDAVDERPPQGSEEN